MKKLITQTALLFAVVAALVVASYTLVGFQMAVLVAVVATGCGMTIIVSSALEPKGDKFSEIKEIKVAKLAVDPDDLGDDGFMPEDILRNLMQKIADGEMPPMGVIKVNEDGSFDIEEPEEPKLTEEEAKALSEKWDG